MTGIVYLDDGQIVQEILTKAWGPSDNEIGVTVTVYVLPRNREEKEEWNHIGRLPFQF